MCYLLSSPYLLVFGDDRVRGTREQMMLLHVSRWCCCRWFWWGLASERDSLGVYLFYDFDIICKLLW